MQITIIKTGIANTASVFAAFYRLGLEVQFTSIPQEVTQAKALVLPGVGSFGAGMKALEKAGLVAPLKERILAGAPTLAICLGMQLLCDTSDESQNVAGLGIIPARVKRFPESVRTPQFGWNEVKPNADCQMLANSGYAYFANSYRLIDAPPDWAPAFSDHGGQFVAALEKGALLACQFHPELSGAWGQEVLKRWTACAQIPIRV